MTSVCLERDYKRRVVLFGMFGIFESSQMQVFASFLRLWLSLQIRGIFITKVLSDDAKGPSMN